MYTYIYIYIYICIERERERDTCHFLDKPGANTVSSHNFRVCTSTHLCTHGSFPIGLVSNRARFKLGSIRIAFPPNALPN